MKIIISTYSSPKNHSVPVYAHNALFMGKIQAPFITQFQLYFHHGFLKNIFIYSLAIIYTMYIHIYTHKVYPFIYIIFTDIHFIHYNFIYTMVISIPYSLGHFPHNKSLSNFHILSFFLSLSNYH